MIKRIYGKYFQKSKSFLYPALGIKKNDRFAPSGTYLSIKGYIEPEDTKFICTFDKDDSEAFIYFENKMLLENPLFVQKIEKEDFNVYIFNFDIYQKDWFNFILGKYSKLSSVLKKAIKNYYGENSVEYEYIHSYLHPKEYFDIYSELLDVEYDVLVKSGELCDPCDLDKETLEINIENLEELKKTI